MVDKFFQGAGALGEPDQEIMFQAFILKGPFLDLLHAVDVVVAAADDTYDGLSFNGVGIIVQGRDAEGAGGFDDDGVFIVEFEDGGAYFSFGHQVHVIQNFPADAEGEVSYSFYGGSVHEAFDTVQGHGVAGFQGCQHGGGSLGLQTDDLCTGGLPFEIGAYSGSEAAAADGGEQIVDLGQVFQDLYGYGALSFDDLQVVEGRDKGHLIFFR